MKFVPVEALPRKIKKGEDHCRKKDLYAMLDEFDKSSAQFVKVEVDIKYEYATQNSAFCSIRHSIRDHGYSMKVVIRQGDIYIVKVEKQHG